MVAGGLCMWLVDGDPMAVEGEQGSRPVEGTQEKEKQVAVGGRFLAGVGKDDGVGQCWC